MHNGTLKKFELIKIPVKEGFKFNLKEFNGVALTKFRKATRTGRHAHHPKYDAQLQDFLLRNESKLADLAEGDALIIVDNLINGNSRYKGLKRIIDETEALAFPLNKINELKLELSSLNLDDLLIN